MRRIRNNGPAFSRAELRRLGGYTAAVAALHLLGWGLFALYARRFPELVGLGTLAYTFGLRHAFDVDHIAAIDNTARRLLQAGRRSLGVGFFFSLGHATVVLGLTAALAVAAGAVSGSLPALGAYGGVVGASVAGVFLLLIGCLNLVVLRDVIRVFRALGRGPVDEAALEQQLVAQGPMSRLFLRRLGDRIDRGWKMYPVGLLFGLGFDTATEVALLALAAGAATRHAPVLAVLSLPILFAAGMSLLDTIDGAFMTHAYGWAFSTPVRKVYYNLTVTSLSVGLALAVGALDLGEAVATKLGGGAPRVLGSDRAGLLVAALFVAVWIVSAAVWRLRRIEQRWTAAVDAGR